MSNLSEQIMEVIAKHQLDDTGSKIKANAMADLREHYDNLLEMVNSAGYFEPEKDEKMRKIVFGGDFIYWLDDQAKSALESANEYGYCIDATKEAVEEYDDISRQYLRGFLRAKKVYKRIGIEL